MIDDDNFMIYAMSKKKVDAQREAEAKEQIKIKFMAAVRRG